VKLRATQAIATFGYVGLLPGPVGVWASAAAIPAAYALHWLGGFPLLALATLAAGAAGYWSAKVEAIDLEGLDRGAFVIDAVVGQWIALWPLSAGLWAAGAAPDVFPWPGWVAAFLFFRFFASVRPGPVGWAARRNGPAGVMLDDVIAGALSAALVAAAAALAHGWLR